MPCWSDMYWKVTHVYRLYDVGDNLLYVGISNRVNDRVRQHMRRQPWGNSIAGATFERFPCRIDAQVAEREAIRTENPIHNITRPAEVWV